jgi:F-type H+-transporting ATPase subunit delta
VALRGAAARRYAEAVFAIAKESNSLDRWLQELQLVARLFGTAAAVSTLQDPKLTEADHKRIINEQLANQKVDPLVVNFLLLLVRRQRLGLLPRILELFQEMFNKERGIVVAHVTTAVPLDEAHMQRVAQQLSRITGGKRVELRMRADPRILGGIITRIGDELVDASVAARLAELAQRLS